MTVSRIYRNFLIQDIIRESLRQGVVLTKGEIDKRFEEIISSNPQLNQPFTQRSLYQVADSEPLSSSKMNRTIEAMINDMSVAYSSLVEQAKNVTDTYDAVNSEFKSIEKRIRRLEETASNLLIVSEDVEGYFDFASDKFSNKDKVDLTNSTVFIDSKVGVATLAPLSHSRIPLVVSRSDLQFNVLTRDQLLAITLAPNSNIESAFTDQENAWIQRVEMRRGVGQVTADLILRNPNSTAEVSKIIFKPAVSDEGNISSVTLQYSDDGLNWFNVDGEATKRLIGDITFIFTPTQARFWKFVFNKSGYDEFRGDKYIYEFGAKSIQFYGVEYALQQNKLEGTLVSNILQGEDETEFNRITLKTCESTPAGTGINYEVAGLTASEIASYQSGAISLDDLNFNPIDPIGREETVNPTIIDFSDIASFSGVNSEYSKDSVTAFRYQDQVNVLIDYTVPGNIVRPETKILRNTGDNTLDGGSNTPQKVKRVDRGWAFDGTYYTSFFYVSQDSGLTIDFGDESLEIDNLRTTGQVTLSKGFHKIKTHKNNWREISPADISTTDNPDLLYPYNHKYLIEGIGDTLYGDDMTAVVSGETKKDIVDPDGVYSGVERYWETTLEEVTIFDFTQNVGSENYNVFAFVKDSSGVDRVMIKDSVEPGLLTNEKLAIITRAVSADLHKGIILKAHFSSEDSKTTPVLDEYIIRLGF